MEESCTLIDDIVLKLLFHRRFMDFNLSARLESVSKSFLNHAHHFYSEIDSFDFKDRLINKNTTTCARKLELRCANVTKIRNIPVNNDCLEENIANFCYINKMRNVSLVGIDFQHFSPSVLLPLADMSNLSCLEIATHRADPYEISVDENFVETLHVTSLKCDRLSLLEFCSPDTLEILHLCVYFPAEIEKLIGKLKQYRKIREISIDLCRGVQQSEELLRLVDFIHETAYIKKFSVALENDSSVIVLPELAKHHSFREFLNRLEIIEEVIVKFDPVEMIMDSILKLSNLTSLTLYTLDKIQIDPLLKNLPNLQHLFVSSPDCCPDVEGASFEVKTSYDW